MRIEEIHAMDQGSALKRNKVGETSTSGSNSSTTTSSTGGSAKWEDLEFGVWSNILSRVHNHDDKCSVRRTCKLFYEASSIVIKRLTIDYSKLGNDDNSGITEDIPYFEFMERVDILNAEKLKLLHLQQLARLKHLKHLEASLGEQRVMNNLLQNVSLLKGLRHIGLNECYLETSGLEALQLLPDLKCLKLVRHQPQGEPVMEAIGKLTGLTSLFILKPFCFNDTGYKYLSRLTNLKSLVLGCSWTLGTHNEPLTFLTTLKKLERLAILKCFVSDAGLEPLQCLKSLRELSLSHLHGINGEGLRHLRGLKNLECLSLQDSNRLTIRGIQELSALTKLKALHLGSSQKLTCATWQSLRALKNLTHLAIPSRAAWPGQEKHLPKLKMYSIVPSIQKRCQGVLEDNLNRMYMSGRPNPEELEPTEIPVLEWFHNQLGIDEESSEFINCFFKTSRC